MNAGKKVFLESHALDLMKSQKFKQIQNGPFTVTRRIRITAYEIRDNANLENVGIPRKNKLIECFPKEEQLPLLNTNYTVISNDSVFQKHLINSQIEQYNSGKEK